MLGILMTTSVPAHIIDGQPPQCLAQGRHINQKERLEPGVNMSDRPKRRGKRRTTENVGRLEPGVNRTDRPKRSGKRRLNENVENARKDSEESNRIARREKRRNNKRVKRKPDATGRRDANAPKLLRKLKRSGGRSITAPGKSSRARRQPLVGVGIRAHRFPGRLRPDLFEAVETWASLILKRFCTMVLQWMRGLNSFLF
jgi:hypothetical protein